ncbi:GNAT family N-acetyltransferase [Arthrobacter sp. EH-1B-1]|uniref:GNAT family N-acetyltransferase n=1 Tax=Arthrobacter vasquezii TaxID=2977629 RepID=A0ABT6CWB1_9MICC|nr:GNAT family N-acetyltransferase [Arthrobacter vasquezii]MDF9278173.1 GNAT family N-acetyltransferase [Arthrobacter vasquezii]
MAAEVQVENNSDAGKYEVTLDGKPAGFAAYRLQDQQVIFTHTEVDSAFEGHGLGSALARFALDDVRERGLHAVPRCPFIAAYIERHPEYQDLVAS